MSIFAFSNRSRELVFFVCLGKQTNRKSVCLDKQTNRKSVCLGNYVRSALLLAAITFAPWASAFNYCINTSSSNFNSALILAAASPADDEIRLVQGTYTLTSSQSHDVDGDLSLRGGWNAGCTIQGLNPTDTTITSATPQANTLSLRFFSSSALIERLHFRDLLLQNNIALYASHNILDTRQLLNGATITTDLQNLNVDPLLNVVNWVLGFWLPFQIGKNPSISL
jgi:hypothetical protein